MAETISVIVATRNRADLLERALQTYARQTLPRSQWEYLLMDDLSPDPLVHACANDWADEFRIRYLRYTVPHTRWRDGSVLWNLGALFAAGDILIFTHPEDMVPPHALESVAAFFDRIPTDPPRPVLFVRPYWIPKFGQDSIDAVDWRRDIHQLQDLPDFWTSDNPGDQPGAPIGKSFKNTDMEDLQVHGDFKSWHFAAIRRADFLWFGGLRNSRRWGLVDVDQAGRFDALEALGEIQRFVHPTLMVYHQWHESTRSPADARAIFGPKATPDFHWRPGEPPKKTIEQARHGGLSEMLWREDGPADTDAPTPPPEESKRTRPLKIVFNSYPDLFLGDAVKLHRFTQPARLLASAGHEVVETRDRIDESILEGADVLTFIRNTPDQFPVARYDELREKGVRIVVDLDDNWWGFGNHPGYKKVTPSREYVARYIEMLKGADLVTVPTEEMKKCVSAFTDRIAIAPNFLSFDEIPRRPAAKRDFIRIGFAGGESHTGDLDMIGPALDKLHSLFGSRLEFVFFGHPAIRPYIRHFGMVPNDDYFSTLAGLDLDIGLAPLMNNGLNRCKSLNRWLEYTAVGTITVCSAVGAFAELPEEAAVVVPINTTAGWVDTLTKLIEQRIEPPSIERARWHAGAFSPEEVLPQWQDAYYRAAESPIAISKGVKA